MGTQHGYVTLAVLDAKVRVEKANVVRLTL